MTDEDKNLSSTSLPMATIECDAATSYADALADVLCWFRGFNAAHHGKEDQPQMPPGLSRLLDLKEALQSAGNGKGQTIKLPVRGVW